MVSFRGQKKLGPRSDRSQGFNSKFSTRIPSPFICRLPPGGNYPIYNRTLVRWVNLMEMS